MKQALGSLILASLFLPSQGRFLGLGSSQSEEELKRGLQAAQCPNPDVYPQPPGPPEGCSRSPWNFTFTDGEGGWDGNLGARVAVNTASGIDGEYLTISNRKANWQGPKLEVTDATRGCVDSSVQYFFTVDFRLTKTGGTSDCASGSNCPRLMWNHMNSEEAPRAWNLTQFDPAKYTNDGEWIHWAATVEIDETYVDPTDVFAAIMILGMEPDVTIDIDNFMISMPPEPPAPGPFDICADLFQNGDGLMSNGGVYPWKPLIGLDELTLEDTPGGGFHFSLKNRVQAHSSPIQELIPGCLRDGAKYKLSVQLRVHNPNPSHVYVMVRSGTPPAIKFLPMGRCTSVNGDDFFLCEKEFTRTLGNLPEAPFVVIYTTANLSPKPDMDFANMTMTPISCGIDSEGSGEGEGTPGGTGGTGSEVGDNSCTRGVTVRVDAQFDPPASLAVSDGTTSASVTGSFDSVDAKGDTHWYLAFRKYTMQVGDGAWTADFGTDVWPYYAEVILDDAPTCANYMDSFAITPPAVTNTTCNELIRNGDFETTTDVTKSQWYHTGCGFTIVAGGVTGNALQTTERTHTANGPVQFLDTRCFSTLNSRYKISAKVKFVDPAYSCTLGPQTPGNGRCVRANIRSLLNGVNPQYEYSVGDTVANTAGEWNTLEGYFFVSTEMVAADNIALYFDGPDVGKEFMIDDVTITKEEASVDQCATNGDVAGSSTGWNKYGDGLLAVVFPGVGGTGQTIRFTGRTNINSGPANVLSTECFTAGQVLEISAKIKLKNGNDDWSCNPYQMYTLPDYCPDIILSSNKLGLSSPHVKAAHTVGPYDGSGWNTIYGTVTVTEEMAGWTSFNAFVGRVKAGITEFVDDLSVKPADSSTVGYPSCSQLIKNGDGESGDARFWYLKTGANHGTVNMVDTSSETGNGDWAFHHDGSGRTNTAQGMLQSLDTSCMPLNSKWRITAKFRMYDGSGAQVSCTPGGTCAKFLFQAHGTGQSLANQLTITETGSWPASGWGEFKSTFTYDSNMFGKDNLDVFVHTVPLTWSYDLDDVSIVPL